MRVAALLALIAAGVAYWATFSPSVQSIAQGLYPAEKENDRTENLADRPDIPPPKPERSLEVPPPIDAAESLETEPSLDEIATNGASSPSDAQDWSRYDGMDRNEIGGILNAKMELRGQLAASELDRYWARGSGEEVAREKASLGDDAVGPDHLDSIYYDGDVDRFFVIRMTREESPELFAAKDECEWLFDKFQVLDREFYAAEKAKAKAARAQ